MTPDRARHRPDVQRAREPAAAGARRCCSTTGPRPRRRRRLAGRHRRAGRRARRASFPGASRSSTARRARGLGRSYIDGIKRGARASRSTSSARWTPTSRTTRSICRPHRAAARRGPRHRVALHAGRRDRELAAPAGLLSRFANSYIRASRGLPRARLHERLSLLAAGGAGGAAARPVRVRRLFVPRRDAVRGAARPGCRIAEVPITFVERRLGRIEAVARGALRVGDHAVAARRGAQPQRAQRPD